MLILRDFLFGRGIVGFEPTPQPLYQAVCYRLHYHSNLCHLFQGCTVLYETVCTCGLTFVALYSLLNFLLLIYDNSYLPDCLSVLSGVDFGSGRFMFRTFAHLPSSLFVSYQLVREDGLEPSTSVLSGRLSNLLKYSREYRLFISFHLLLLLKLIHCSHRYG